MSHKKNSWLGKKYQSAFWPLVVIGIAVAGWFMQERWMPYAERFIALIQNKKEDNDDSTDAPETRTPDTLTLSPVAWKNIGLTTGIVKPADFSKVVTVPAIVVERPGRSQNEITAPMTGVVTQIHQLELQAIEPGMPLFDLRLTHENVVTAQADLLTTLQNLDVINRELTRLRSIGDGVIPGKRIIEQEYERDRAVATVSAARQTLLLHGLSEQQIDTMEKTRMVLREITVVAPQHADNHGHSEMPHQYHVQSIKVNRGQNVEAGQLLGVLADHCLLYVEGKAFEEDASRLIEASKEGRLVEVVPLSGTDNAGQKLELKFQSVADQIDRQSRALNFYLLLPNKLVEEAGGSSNSFVAWTYRPGQRMEAKIPTSKVLKNKIVLPADAVVIDGPNAFVFEQNGDNFDRVDVHVLYRDKDTVVLENDGQLVGGSLAMNGAYQMHLALKNQSGGAIDPHAGHNH